MDSENLTINEHSRFHLKQEISSRIDVEEFDVHPSFLAGGGEMGRRIRDLDWTQTSLGPFETWPQSLRSALSICLNSSFPIAVYWGSDLQLLYNDEWSPIPGKKHPWALGRPACEAWPEIWHIIEPLFRRVMTSGEATRSRDQLLPMHRHGFTEECYFDYTFSPIRGESGQVEGVFNAVLETTTRVVGERRLRTLRELGAWKTGEARTSEQACQIASRIMEENLHDLPFTILYLISDDGRNAIRCCQSGLGDDHPAAPAIVPLDARTELWPFGQVVRTGKAVEVHDLQQLFGLLPGGAWPESSEQALILPLVNPGKAKLAGLVVTGISPRLSLNDEYRGFLELLAGHVAAAVASARAYEEERQRAEMLAELDRAKTAFFSNISHEFRTPLTLMLGPVEDLLATSATQLPSEYREQLNVVHHNGLRLQRLVNNLLDFSRIEAGREKASYEPTNLAEFTAELASNFRSACDKAGLELRVDCPPLRDQVFVDRQMYEKIVLNLLSNAFKFTFHGTIDVSIRSVGALAELKVQDTGVGIPTEEMPRLFERFHRVENANGRTHEGSGIGLALVQELVRLHGGSIIAESQVGRGTTFTVSIPFGTNHLPDHHLRSRSPQVPAGAGAMPFVEDVLRWLPQAEKEADGVGIQNCEQIIPTGAPLATDNDRPVVLVAEDNADMRRYITRLLSDHYRVETVVDGEAALLAARRQVPDLILSDVMMPRLDGFEMLRELRTDPTTARIPVILLSARAGEECRVEGLVAGADDYLVKPFSARELVVRVGAVLQINKLRQESERAIRNSEERFRLAADAVNGIIYEYDISNSRVERTRGLYEVLGYHPDEVPDTADWWWEQLHPDDRVDRWQDVRDAAGTGRGLVSIYRVRHKDGRWLFVEDRSVVLANAAGEPIKLIGCTTDVTQRVEAEEGLRHADRCKDEFLATLAHELRNPLAPIRNGLQMIRLANGDIDVIEQARTMMERQLSQLVHLVDDLLDLSRISRGKIELRKERIELAQVVQQAVETSRPAIEQAGHELTITMPMGPIYLDADTTRLAQVFSNILTNAAKYTDKGGRVSLNVEQRNGEVYVSVKDSGVGIPKQMLPRVFDMFTQVDRNLERSQGGLGIGLSIVKRLVEMHGGNVEAKSEGHGMGSEFVVSLPVVKSVARVQKDDNEAPPPASRRRILVVDDNRDAATSLTIMLKLMGNEVKTANDGFEALDVAAEFRPDLILLDIGMPRMNGYDTAEHIRKQPWGNKVVLVALTGWGQDEDRSRSKKAGFDSHMVKPIEPAALERLLTTVQLGTA